jgi:5-methylthioribose kinase
MGELPEDLRGNLIRMGFVGADEVVTAEALTGGVASDIWRVDIAGKSICVKRALEQLKVSQEWRVPVDRNAFEVAWFNTVAEIVPESVPEVLGHDPVAGIFLMEFLPPEQYRVWKSQLRDGVVEVNTALALANILAQIHKGTASNRAIASQFDHDDLFYNLRLEPYLHATAEVHPDVRGQLLALATMVVENKKALVHGDISPKNILVGPRGPIIIDAECAWYGDPAFDLAFCLNHLLLKCVWNPLAKSGLINSFDSMVKTYLSAVSWESAGDLEQRVARLLPGLMLARIDGKSPVEYITDEGEKDRVRRFAKQFLLEPADELSTISAAWSVSR